MNLLWIWKKKYATDVAPALIRSLSSLVFKALQHHALAASISVDKGLYSLNLKFDILFYLLQVARLPFFKVADHRGEKYRWPRPNTSRMVAAYRQWCTREVSWIQTSNSLQWPEALPLISLRLVTSAGYLICPNDCEQCATESAISKGYFSVSLFYLLLAHLLHASSEWIRDYGYNHHDSTMIVHKLKQAQPSTQHWPSRVILS